MIGHGDIAGNCTRSRRVTAAFLRLGRNTVYEWAASGKLPSLRLGSRIRFLPSALRRWLAVQVDLTRSP